MLRSSWPRKHKTVLVAHLRTAHVPPFQIFKSVRVAAQAASTTYLGVAHRIGKISSRPTRRITHHQRCGGKLLKDYRVRKAKSKENHASLLSPTRPSARFTRWARGSTSKTQSPDAGAAFAYATQTQQLFCFEVAVCFLCMPSHGTGPQHGTCGCAQSNVHCCTSSSNPARTFCVGREWLGPSHLMLVDQTTWC